MAINIDTTKPLTEDQIEDLRTRLPESLVQRYIELGNAAAAEEPKAEPRKAAAKGKGDDLL